MGPLLELYTGFLSIILIGLLGIRFLKPKEEKAAYRSNYSPKALVIVPCRGLDITLEKNLASAKMQDYENFNIIGVVDTEKDPAVAVLKKVGINYIVSAPELLHVFPNSSGKVRALTTAFERFRNVDVYVVLDSDVQCSRNWLSMLVAPLADKSVGASTSFPYFRPMGGFWSKVKSVWGLVGNGLMENKKTRFAWGGSMAFRKSLITKKFIKAFGDSVSDDIMITKEVKRKKLKVAYVKDIATVNSYDDFPMFFEWSNRQTALSALEYRKNLKVGIIFYSARILLMASALVLAYYISILYAVFFAPLLLNIAAALKKPKEIYPSFLFILLFIDFIYLINLVLAIRTPDIP